MHSRIFQFSTEPITPNQLFTEGDLIDNERVTSKLSSIVDYYDFETNRDEDYKWLMSFLAEQGMDVSGEVEELPLDKTKGIFTKTYSISFDYYDLMNYMEEKMNAVQDALDAVFDLDLEKDSDASQLNGLRYVLQKTINDEFSFYILMDDDVKTIDDFLASLFYNCNREDVYTFYVGATIDYHS